MNHSRFPRVPRSEGAAHSLRAVSTVGMAALSALLLLPRAASAQLHDPGYTIEQALSVPTAANLVAAKKAERIAWIELERGRRNVFTAAGPDWRPVRLTNNTEDDGVDMSGLAISDDGSMVIYETGHPSDRDQQVGNQGHDALGGQRVLWAASTAGGRAPWRVMQLTDRRKQGAVLPAVVTVAPATGGGRGGRGGAAAAPDPAAAASGRGGRGGGGGGAAGGGMELSPNGKSLLFVADGQIRRVSVDPAPATPPLMDEVPPYFATLGVNSAPQWSPDGKKIAFVSSRYDQRQLFPTQGGQVTHSFITLYDVDTKKITYLTQTVDRDTNPAWSADGKSVSFVRRPGLAFSHFATTPTTSVTRDQVPAGLLEGRLEDGAAVALVTADVATAAETVTWHSAKATGLPSGTRVGDYFISSQNQNSWTRYFSTGIAAPDVVKPAAQLTPEGDGQVEHVAYSPDGRFMYFVSSVGDLDHRHLWRVPVAGGQPVQLTKGELNEIGIAIPGSGSTVAVLQSGFKQPVSVVVMNPMAQQAKVIAPQVTPAMQIAKHVVPQSVAITAADGLVSRAIVFTPPGIRPGEKRPALVYAHGNGGRLLLGYPDQGDNAYYQLNYALINYYVNKGYIVAAINYRGDCTCYSEAFNRQGPEYGANGVEEYRDVIATGLYLKGRPDVDAERLGIWGLSYGGWLTGEALSRNSDVFKAGAILAGVQLRSTSFDPTNLAFQSSPMFNIDKWTSPTLFVHGDDDRNVEFSQAIGAIQALRAKGTPHKIVVLPDETHYYLKWENLVKGSQAEDAWFDQMLIKKAVTSGK